MGTSTPGESSTPTVQPGCMADAGAGRRDRSGSERRSRSEGETAHSLSLHKQDRNVGLRGGRGVTTCTRGARSSPPGNQSGGPKTSHRPPWRRGRTLERAPAVRTSRRSDAPAASESSRWRSGRRQQSWLGARADVNGIAHRGLAPRGTVSGPALRRDTIAPDRRRRGVAMVLQHSPLSTEDTVALTVCHVGESRSPSSNEERCECSTRRRGDDRPARRVGTFLMSRRPTSANPSPIRDPIESDAPGQRWQQVLTTDPTVWRP